MYGTVLKSSKALTACLDLPANSTKVDSSGIGSDRASLGLLQGGLPFLAQPQGVPGGTGPTTLQQQGPPLLPGQALAQTPGTGVADSGQDTSGVPSLVSVVYDGYLSDCTARPLKPFLAC